MKNGGDTASGVKEREFKGANNTADTINQPIN